MRSPSLTEGAGHGDQVKHEGGYGRGQQLAEDGKMVVTGPAREHNAPKGGGAAVTACVVLPVHDLQPGDVVLVVTVQLGQEEALTKRPLEGARHPDVAECVGVFLPGLPVDESINVLAVDPNDGFDQVPDAGSAQLSRGHCSEHVIPDERLDAVCFPDVTRHLLDMVEKEEPARPVGIFLRRLVLVESLEPRLTLAAGGQVVNFVASDV